MEFFVTDPNTDPKTSLIENLQKMNDRDGEHLWVGDRVLSINELIDEVRAESELGLQFIKAHSRVEKRRAAYELARNKPSRIKRLIAFFRKLLTF